MLSVPQRMMDVSLSTQTRFFKCSFFYQYAATISANLLMVSCGMHYGWPSPSIPILLDINSDNSLHVESTASYWIIVAYTIGIPFGCVLSSILVDRIGRQRCLLFTSPMMLTTWWIIAYAPSALILGSARFVAGIATGFAQSILPIYLCEISDKSIRGLLSSTSLVAWKIGSLAANVVGVYVTIKKAALLASSISALHILLFYFMPESPRFYILKNKDHKAVACLNKLMGFSNGDTDVSQMAVSIRAESRCLSSLKNLLRSLNRKALKIIFGLFLIGHLSGYHAFTFYGLTIFTATGGPIEAETATIIFFTTQIFVAILSSILLDITGRKPLLIASAIGTSFALAVAGSYLYLKEKTSVDVTSASYIPLLALIAWAISSNTGLTIIPVLMLGEIFPMSSKAFAICITNIYSGTLSTVVTKFFQFTKDEYGMHLPFLVFATSCAASLLFIIYFVPETKGKTLEEIQIMLAISKRKNETVDDVERENGILLNSKTPSENL